MVSLTPGGALADADDRTVATRAADGDIRAFETLMRRYGSLMNAYAARIVSPSEAEDVVQETFIAAWRDLPTLDKPGSVRSWLITVVTRTSIDRLRAKRDQPSIDELEVEDPADGPEQTAAVTSLDEALTKALSMLPEDQRRCWTLRELSGYDYHQIAGELALPVSTVRGLLARGRKALISEMEEWR